MKKGLLIFGVLVLLSACTLADEKEAAGIIAKELGATEFTVADTTIFEKKEEHPTLVLYFKDPKMESPEMDPIYLSSKTAYNFVQTLGFEKASAYHNIAINLDLKGYNYNKYYSLKTLNGIAPYYSKTKNFIIGVNNGDTATVLSYLKPDVIAPADMLQVYLTDDDQQVKYGNATDIKIAGFEETRTKITDRAVIATRAIVYRQGTPAEVYNLTFDIADQKIVGLGWDILKRANEANVPEE